MKTQEQLPHGRVSGLSLQIALTMPWLIQKYIAISYG